MKVYVFVEKVEVCSFIKRIFLGVFATREAAEEEGKKIEGKWFGTDLSNYEVLEQEILN